MAGWLGGWVAGWLRKAESKAKAQHSWGWNFAELGNFQQIYANLLVTTKSMMKHVFLEHPENKKAKF